MKNTQEIENALREGETIFPCGGCKKNIFAKVKIEKAIVVCPICSSERKYHLVRDFADGSGIKDTEFSKNMVGLFEAILEAAEVSE